MAKKPKLGSGARFKALKGKLAKKGAKNPGALAAWIGRKKYGKAKFQKLAAKGRKKGKEMSPVVSKSQFKKFFWLYEHKQISKKTLDEWTRGVNYHKLPRRKRKKA